ncbi:hypothetical protein IFM89_027144 [Coptis chinensis]|uniref:FBD domain-containing protein n=1 Tax=Coptis chinensis TaxID=261450 RepID=A0A835I5N6_9MAGN|nr:hypothetical protein IFM89_027144 [Coptis chinensis]
MEKLELVNWKHMYLTSISISAPQLKYLLVESYYAYAESGKIKICAPSLTSLKLEGHIYEEYCLENLSSLVTAEIYKATFNSLEDGGDWGKQLSFQCPFDHCKCIEIWELVGCENELKLLKFLFRNAVVLESIVINLTKMLSKDKEVELVEFSKKLKDLCRASSGVKILLMLKKTAGMTVVFEDFSGSPHNKSKKC